uniref:Uncharacterized protein n=1 Tax=Monopterus albus TaxID=43700 RepID=A0A3Q3QQM3_MONAL
LTTKLVTSLVLWGVTQPRPFATVSNRWTSGICDCFQDPSSCCFAFWHLLPCLACKAAHEAEECLCLPLLNAFVLSPPMTIALRVSVHQKYGTGGTPCKNCVYGCFCRPCTWCQIAREMKSRMNIITNMSRCTFSIS